MVKPSKWANLKSNFLKFHHQNQVISSIGKAWKAAYFRAFLAFLSCRLALAELKVLPKPQMETGLILRFPSGFHRKAAIFKPKSFQ